ncbi:hypothetical protein DL766_010295 [Monosporascus sp. MC13-8B]|uniref:Uncharacterized protein n=1 Tax=Monosporascus cannonballus TaxID=155416 RepID=A0ABY0HFB2_9PEZI|nr:hypothetical protein DL762_001783 [Monosporascus cannonballus]RYO93787.1 hypothetical protein DL763_004272 [Monosporascus cannonballus]RYP02552.1 hypothetical protein DL766_010295 [Monosporascus sp. MC13-8B]
MRECHIAPLRIHSNVRLRDQDEDVNRKAQEAVLATADAVLDQLPLQARHAREIGADARFEQAEDPEQQALGLQHSPEGQAAAGDDGHAITTLNAPCVVWAAVKGVHMMDLAIVAHMKLKSTSRNGGVAAGRAGSYSGALQGFRPVEEEGVDSSVEERRRRDT